MARLLLYVVLAVSLSVVQQILNVLQTPNYKYTTEYIYRATLPTTNLSEKEEKVFLQEETFALREL